jgi:dihydrofolate reductase
MSQPKMIVAFTAKGMGIGKDGKIPWSIREDLARFAMVTWGEAVIMGTKTWLSLPRRPLADRWNIVVTTQWPNVMKVWNDNTLIIHESELGNVHNLSKAKIFWVIGGAKLYARYMGIAEEIHATIIDKDFDCDVHFPLAGFNTYVVDSYSELKFSDTDRRKRRHIPESCQENPRAR